VIAMLEELTIIAKQKLNIKTLETRNSDELDFYEVSVWNLKEALEAAYIAGKSSATITDIN
jgi:hypothetical protein